MLLADDLGNCLGASITIERLGHTTTTCKQQNLDEMLAWYPGHVLRLRGLGTRLMKCLMDMPLLQSNRQIFLARERRGGCRQQTTVPITSQLITFHCKN